MVDGGQLAVWLAETRKQPGRGHRQAASVAFSFRQQVPSPVAFADPRRSYTRAFERYALELSRCMTIQDVAHHLGVSWDLIKEIYKENDIITLYILLYLLYLL